MSPLRKISTFARLATRPDFYYLAMHPSGNGLAPADDLTHAAAAVDWLLLAHTVCEGRGFSKLYSVKLGWYGPYVETTGYIIPTLFDFARTTDHRRAEISAALQQSLEFLMANQYQSGAFGDSTSTDPLVYRSDSPMVFDTGQVIFGLLAGHRNGDGGRCLESARRAGDWLLETQEQDGTWRRFTYTGKARTYYSRVAHALVELWRETGDGRYRDGAVRMLRWVVTQQTPAGSFRQCSFTSENSTVLHVIAYTLDGLWKAGELLDEPEFREASMRGAEALARIQRRDGMLAGHLTMEFRASDPARCLTGLAQMAEVWLLIHQAGGHQAGDPGADDQPGFLEAADEAIRFLKTKQILDRSKSNLYGGLPGSHPWSGPYFPWAIPNWPQKFFIDALLLRDRIRRAETIGRASASA